MKSPLHLLLLVTMLGLSAVSGQEGDAAPGGQTMTRKEFEAKKKTGFAVLVDAKGSILIRDQVFSDDQFQAICQSLAESFPDKPVSIGVSEKTDAGRLKEILALVLEAGVLGLVTTIAEAAE